MAQDLAIYNFESSLAEIDKINSYIKKLITQPHYAKIGEAGIFAIIHKAKTLGINPLDALNGGLFFVQGIVEMRAQMMNQLIRQNGHSIQKDARSNDEICILHGKRADNGDIWTESFSIRDAQQAGIYREGPWKKYPKDMLFARALSRLARQLFPDVIKGCYVEGEIEKSNTTIETEFEDVTQQVEKPKRKSKTVEFTIPVEEPKKEFPTEQEAEEFLEVLGQCEQKYQKTLREYFKSKKITDVDYPTFLQMREKVANKAAENKSMSEGLHAETIAQ